MADFENQINKLGKDLVDLFGMIAENLVRDSSACEALLALLSKDIKQAGDILDRLDSTSEDLIDIAVAAQALSDMAYRRSERPPPK